MNPQISMINYSYPVFWVENHHDHQFASTFRQRLGHENSDPVLVIKLYLTISLRRPFVSSQTVSRFYFSLSNRK